MKTLNDLFEVSYGNKLDLNKMCPAPRNQGGISFIGRSGRRHGLSGVVAKIESIDPYPAGLITVALGGTPLASFVQRNPFYTAQNVAVLRPRESMSFAEKVFTCLCIRHNRFRYSAFGREANRTLRDLPIPGREDFPIWVRDVGQTQIISSQMADSLNSISLGESLDTAIVQDLPTVSDLFEISYGNSYELCNLKRDYSGVNYVSRRTGNNGVSAKVAKTSDEPFPAGLLTVALNGQGGALETCVQASPFYTGFHVAILKSRKPMTLAAKLFYAKAITMNRFRYGFGRQANRTLKSLRLPSLPDWATQSLVVEAEGRLRREIASSMLAVSPS